MYTIQELRCPGCGENWSVEMKVCPSCRRPVMISSIASVNSISPLELKKYSENYQKILSNTEDRQAEKSLALCFIKLKLYKKALSILEKSLEYEVSDAEGYFLACVCLLEGKKPFLTQRPIIDKIEEYLEACMAMQQKGIYAYFSAYVKYDYFERKGYSTSPNYEEYLALANEWGCSAIDKQQLFELLNVSPPETFI